ncbi:MAG: copper amine oxidase N-terminal domain-containing protein, partial [Oscillospiraceae bacterium]|nr:copper amine oxidase N-terminal domain-containing protein [Oscillospiraceae bacterium]
ASAMMLSASAAVLADETNPDVYVDGALITFNDQPAIITDDRTLIPARGVFEAMDAKVTWDGDERTVTINSKDNITRVILTIDSPEMTVYTFTSLLSADTETVTLDVAPQILNDRTMIPFRAVSEALNADVEWDSDSYTVNIVTSDMPESTEGMPTLSLAAPETTVEAGEEFDIYINLENIVSDSWLSGLSAVVSYDKVNYEFVN